MTPMRESSSHSPISQKSRQLLGTMPPLIPSDEQIHRIRQSLESRRSRSRPYPIRWAVAVAVLLVCAVAGAAWSAGLGFAPHRDPRAPAFSSIKQQIVQKSDLAMVPKNSVAVAPSGSELPLASVASSLSLLAVASNSRRIEPNAQIDAVAIVHAAAVALRRDHNPSRALQLLAKIGGNVRGPLAEEALALQVEAAVAAGDSQSRNFARSYLRSYPSGRYSDLAKKVLEGQ
jgi:hypothetical protein